MISSRILFNQRSFPVLKNLSLRPSVYKSFLPKTIESQVFQKQMLNTSAGIEYMMGTARTQENVWAAFSYITPMGSFLQNRSLVNVEKEFLQFCCEQDLNTVKSKVLDYIKAGNTNNELFDLLFQNISQKESYLVEVFKEAALKGDLALVERTLSYNLPQKEIEQTIRLLTCSKKIANDKVIETLFSLCSSKVKDQVLKNCMINNHHELFKLLSDTTKEPLSKDFLVLALQTQQNNFIEYVLEKTSLQSSKQYSEDVDSSLSLEYILQISGIFNYPFLRGCVMDGIDKIRDLASVVSERCSSFTASYLLGSKDKFFGDLSSTVFTLDSRERMQLLASDLSGYFIDMSKDSSLLLPNTVFDAITKSDFAELLHSADNSELLNGFDLETVSSNEFIIIFKKVVSDYILMLPMTSEERKDLVANSLSLFKDTPNFKQNCLLYLLILNRIIVQNSNSNILLKDKSSESLLTSVVESLSLVFEGSSATLQGLLLSESTETLVLDTGKKLQFPTRLLEDLFLAAKLKGLNEKNPLSTETLVLDTGKKLQFPTRLIEDPFLAAKLKGLNEKNPLNKDSYYQKPGFDNRTDSRSDFNSYMKSLILSSKISDHKDRNSGSSITKEDFQAFESKQISQEVISDAIDLHKREQLEKNRRQLRKSLDLQFVSLMDYAKQLIKARSSLN